MMPVFLKINFTESFIIVLKVAPFADVLKLDRTGSHGYSVTITEKLVKNLWNGGIKLSQTVSYCLIM